MRDTATAAGALALHGLPVQAARTRTVLVWSEGSAPKNIYPQDINHAIAEGLAPLRGWHILTAGLSDPDQGVSDATLDSTDVLIWWGHMHHGDVRDDRVNAIASRVRAGRLGFIPTHSAHWSKPFIKLMGTTCSWDAGYHEDGSGLLVSVAAPKHPIAHGIKNFVVPHTERYGEPFQAPNPETLVFDGTYTLPDGSKEHSRQGMTWTVDKGRVFYFQPGHESYPIYYQEEIRRVFRNAVKWCQPR